MGDGDQSVLPCESPEAKYLRELWSTGGDVSALCQSRRLDSFALKCIIGNCAGVRADLEACITAAQKTELLETRRSILRLPAIWFPLLGHAQVRGHPTPDNLGTLRVLLHHGARPDSRDICGKTFVHYASGPLCIDEVVFKMMDAVISAHTRKKTDQVGSWMATRVAAHAIYASHPPFALPYNQILARTRAHKHKHIHICKRDTPHLDDLH